MTQLSRIYSITEYQETDSASKFASTEQETACWNIFSQQTPVLLLGPCTQMWQATKNDLTVGKLLILKTVIKNNHYICNIKISDIKEFIYKTETDSQTQRMNLRLPSGEEWGKWIHREFVREQIHVYIYRVGPAILEKSAGATGLKMISFHFNPKERQWQRIFELQHKCTHFTRQQSNAQNSPV